MKNLCPPALQINDTLGLVAPSSPLTVGRLEPGCRYLVKQGFNVKKGSYLKSVNRFLAGEDKCRAKDIMDFFYDPTVKAIIATAGGYGSQRLLPHLDYSFIQKNPKALVGFSDTTALQLGLFKQTGLVSYSGFTLRDTQHEVVEPLIERTLISCLKNEAYEVKEGVSLRGGKVEGPLIGGTLSLIVALMGTPYQPDFKGSILFFEEVWAEPFQIDSMLSQLELAGVFEVVNGIIVGKFEHCVAKHQPERDGTVEDVIEEWKDRWRVPCLKDFPYGHGDRRCVLPIGKTVKVDVDQATLTVPPSFLIPMTR